VKGGRRKEEECQCGRQRGEKCGDGRPMVVEGRHGLRRGRHLLQQAQAVHSSSRRTSSSRCSSNRLEQRAKIQGIGSWTAERIRRLRTVEGTRQCVWMRMLLPCMRFFIRASHATVVRIFDPRAQFGFARAVLFSFWYRLFYANCNTSFFSNHHH
jgi:hypothetical protein